MRIQIIPSINEIEVDGESVITDYSVPANIEWAFYDDVKKHGKIRYNDSTPNAILTSMPNGDAILEAYQDEITKQSTEPKVNEWEEAVYSNGSWAVQNKTDASEIKTSMIRSERDDLLSKSDYIMMPDYPLSDKTEIEIYRQSLRDVPEQPSFPDDVIWPQKPDYL